MVSLRRRSVLAAGAGLAGTAFLPACAGDDDGGASEVEMPDVPIGVLKVPDTAPLYIAQREGIFAKHGLRPQFVESQLTGDNRFDLENGNERLHFDSWVTIFLNIRDGADWVLVGEAYETGLNTSAVLGLPSSQILSARELQGKRIGVNNRAGLGVMLINALLATVGLPPSDVQYVEMPFDRIAAALRQGETDAGWLVEPYLTVAQLETGAVTIADTAVGPTLDLPQSGYVCARSFAARNPRTVQAFQNALAEAHVRALDRTALERELTNPDYLAVTPTVASLMNIGTYPSSLRAVRPQRVADLMLTQGMLTQQVNVADRIARTNT